MKSAWHDTSQISTEATFFLLRSFIEEIHNFTLQVTSNINDKDTALSAHVSKEEMRQDYHFITTPSAPWGLFLSCINIISSQ